MVAQLAEDISALMRMARRHIVVTDRDDARHDRDDLRQVFVQRRRRRGAAHAREHSLNRVDDQLGLCLQVCLEDAPPHRESKKTKRDKTSRGTHSDFGPRVF